MFCSLMGVKYCSVTGINDFAGIFSAGPGSPVVSLHSSIWYYLALIELSSIPSLWPPPVLLSYAPSQGRIIRKTAWIKPSLVFSPRRKQQLPISRQAPVFSFPSVFSPITSTPSLYSSVSVFSPFSPDRPLLFLFAAPCVSHSLPQPIINFNLRAGLNGTIRERSMLSI